MFKKFFTLYILKKVHFTHTSFQLFPYVFSPVSLKNLFL